MNGVLAIGLEHVGAIALLFGETVRQACVPGALFPLSADP
jgi:uncharacterized membrane protein YphA (DoxX/SURF4 family)